MGGFGSGGNRSGSGRKAKPKHLRLIDGGADRRGSGQETDGLPPADATRVEAPDDLSPEERAVWDHWAPRAHQERTLTPSTCANFVLMCQLEVDRRWLRARYSLHRSQSSDQPRALLHMGSEEEMAVRREHRALVKDLKAMMKDFRLAPFGKELDGGDTGEAAVDPLDQFTRKP